MLKKEDILIRTLDYQELFFLTPEQWEILREYPILEGKLINEYHPKIEGKAITGNIIQRYDNYRYLYEKYPELSNAIAFFGRSWYFYTILSIQGSEQRVYLERIICEHCQWFGHIGNPLVDEMYYYLLDPIATNAYPIRRHIEQELRQKAYKHPILPCINCGKTLPPRHPIWVEY